MIKDSKIKPFFWYNDQAEEAARFYTSIFKDSKLGAIGGKPQQCGWLKDKFGVSWQVVPARMERFFRDVNEARRVMQTLMKMVKSIFGNWRR